MMMMLVNVPVDGLDVERPVKEGVEEVINDKDAGYRKEDIGRTQTLPIPNGIGFVVQISQ